MTYKTYFLPISCIIICIVVFVFAFVRAKPMNEPGPSIQQEISTLRQQVAKLEQQNSYLMWFVQRLCIRNVNYPYDGGLWYSCLLIRGR